MSNTRKATGVPQDLQPTAPGKWKKTDEMLTLPSGNVLRVKNPGIMELAHKGLVPNSLMTVIMDSIKKGRQPKPEEILSDNLDIGEMFAMMDNSIIAMAVEPVILPVPIADEEGIVPLRDSNAVYIDDLTEEDKMFIWSWATGGTTDVEQFRAESSGMLASLSGQSAMGSAPKRAAARKK